MKPTEFHHTNGFSPILVDTVSERVYQHIKNAIIRGDLRTGERITQKTLTEQLQVSRTPVRDALQRLSAEGLVKIKPFHGAEVFELSESDLHELYDIRIMMENYAIKHSVSSITDAQIDELRALNEHIRLHMGDVQECMNADRAFHLLLCCSNDLILVRPFLDSVWDKSNPYKALYFTDPAYLEKTYAQHNIIIEGLVRKDPNTLATAIDHHLRDVVIVVSKSPLFSRPR